MPGMRIVKSAEVRRQEVLDCAARLFATQGYEETSIQQIIATLGISKGAFYHHYASKEDLLEALASRFAAEAAGRARVLLDDPSLDPFERLSMFLSRMRMSKVEAAAELQAAFAPIFQKDNNELYERTQAAVNGIIRPILARIIAEGVADKTFDTSDPEEATEVILHLMASSRPIVTDLYQSRTDAELDRNLERLLHRMAFLGTTVDRILGIPEGSLELADPMTVRAMTSAWRKAISAA